MAPPPVVAELPLLLFLKFPSRPRGSAFLILTSRQTGFETQRVSVNMEDTFTGRTGFKGAAYLPFRDCSRGISEDAVPVAAASWDNLAKYCDV